MKFCSTCGAELQDNTRFCPKCGNKTLQLESQEETANSSNNEETTNINSELTNNSNDSGMPIFKKRFPNHKMIITITAAVLCVVIIGIICLKHIPYKCFDIKDDELIEILNECGIYTTHSPLEIDGFTADVTTYKIAYEDETGVLVLSHSFSGHIRCMMVAMEDTLLALAIMSSIVSELDSSSYSENIITSLLENRIYSSNKFSMMTVNLSSDLTGVVSAPKEHFEYCVKSILDN